MNIILLGSTGYLGAKLVQRLLRHRHTIYALVRKTSNIEALLESGLMKENIWEIDKLSMLVLQNSIDLVINCACCYEKAGIEPEQVWEANYSVPLNTILKCVGHGVGKIITIDTGLPNDFNFYSKSKAQLADFLRWYACKTDIHVQNILLENFYGEDEPLNRFLPSVINKLKMNQEILLTEGTQRRDFIYIEDVLSAIEFLIDHKITENYEDIPLGTGEGPMVREVIQYLSDITGSSSRLIFGAVPKRKNEPDSIADVSVLERLGWKCEYKWKEGLKKLI